MTEGTPERSLAEFVHQVGMSTSTGGYLIRRDDTRLEGWVNANLIKHVEDHRHPEWCFFYLRAK